MDLVPLIDRFGEAGTAAIGGAVLGMLFGFLAQRSGFCTRSAVLQLANGGKQPAIWLLGFGAAVLGAQALLYAGLIDVAETRFFATAQSLSGTLIGGALFGVGMVLTRGCASRLLVLASGGNLHAWFSVAIIAAVAWATLNGVLTPLRDALAGLWSTADIGGNALLAHAGLGHAAGLTLGFAVLAVGAFAAIRRHVSPWLAAGGVAVGAVIPAAWYFSWALSTQVFEPIQVEGISYLRPLASTLDLAVSAGGEGSLNMDTGLIAGTVFGAFLAALLFGDWKLRGFGEAGAPPAWRYALGSALMGFGGVLAGGCTIGAGFTGGSVLAVSSLLALAAMMVSAALAHRLIDETGAAKSVATPATLSPAG